MFEIFSKKANLDRFFKIWLFHEIQFLPMEIDEKDIQDGLQAADCRQQISMVILGYFIDILNNSSPHAIS